MLNIVTWLWGDKYGAEDVQKLRHAIARNVTQRYRLLVECSNLNVAPMIRAIGAESVNCMWDEPLTHVRGCFARLRMFDPLWQAARGISLGERIVCTDLDTVVTGGLDYVFERPEDFVIMRGYNAANPCPYLGALFMLRAGSHSDVWADFSLSAADEIPRYEFADDQGWLWHKIDDGAGWYAGGKSGVYAFAKPGWPKGSELPADARLVTFPGWRSPQQFRHLPWVRDHWRA